MEYYRSPLNDISSYHVAAGQIPQDIMHVLFEGVLHFELRLMLNAFVSEEHLFSLELLNSRITNFIYGRNELRNKPSKPIKKTHLTGRKLPLSGNEIYWFLY